MCRWGARLRFPASKFTCSAEEDGESDRNEEDENEEIRECAENHIGVVLEEGPDMEKGKEDEEGEVENAFCTTCFAATNTAQLELLEDLHDISQLKNEQIFSEVSFFLLFFSYPQRVLTIRVLNLTTSTELTTYVLHLLTSFYKVYYQSESETHRMAAIEQYQVV